MKKEVNKFRDTLRQFEREIALQNEDCCNTGLSIGQCHLMLDIESCKQASVTELAQIQHLDKSTVSRTIENLHKKGLINREVNPESRRQSTISLNIQGEKACFEINRINNDFFNQVFVDLSKEELACFNKVFEKITLKMTELRQNDFNCCNPK